MKKFFVTNLIFMLTLNILIKSFWILGIDRGVQNALQAGQYGVYFALLNFTYLFNIVLDFGITSFNNRTIAQNSVLLKKYFAKILPLKLLLAGVYTVILFTAAAIGNYDAYSMHLLRWLCILQIMTSLMTYLRSNISALMLFKTDSILSVMDKSLTIISCSFLLWCPYFRQRFTVDMFVYAQVLSLALTALTALIICLVKTGFVRLDWDTKFMRAVLRYGFPYALLTLLMSFYNRMDSVMLERMLDDNGLASGIYAAGFRLVDSANMIAYLFSVILLPLFAKMIKEKKDVGEIVRISFNMLLLISTGFVCICLAYGKQLIELMYNKYTEQSLDVLNILCFCFIPVSMTYIFGSLLTANGSLKKLNTVAACGMVLNIAVNLILIPHFAQTGSAVASLCSQSVTAVLQIAIAVSIFRLNISYKYVLKIIFYLAGITVTTLVLRTVLSNWIIAAAVSLVSYVAVAFLCRIFSVKEIVNLVKQNYEQ
ncbi:MAG: oligosaccharide flippase family protein [Bacteroidales bacterium]|nr:oligosaccharide flippase family protein [Bacteroidales bacterium]